MDALWLAEMAPQFFKIKESHKTRKEMRAQERREKVSNRTVLTAI